MGDPAETYTYGTLYWLGCFAAPFVGILNNYFYLPVFYELQITSIYEVRHFAWPGITWPLSLVTRDLFRKTLSLFSRSLIEYL
jgi:hypothetical protein